MPATGVTESGTVSRFSFMDDAPPGYHGNIDADKLPGNPDIRVPERVERENGLRARGAERQENADRGERRQGERPEDRGRRLNIGEILEAKDQGRIETKRRPEGRRLRHVPGGTWLNKGLPMYRDSMMSS
ncbi:hypothetical protein NDU88_004929 [Pleurodeles waltl]|uniref:Uncharacterized protein n=1 Tax=Pleurodeles waltl TaxID=8319 RepID=A0AAV7QE44_PLEWA|nr:hypothetical protein NDU88_004929 [Pleurodeles waltl]